MKFLVTGVGGQLGQDHLQLAAGHPLEALAQQRHTKQEKAQAAQQCNGIRDTHKVVSPFRRMFVFFCLQCNIF